MYGSSWPVATCLGRVALRHSSSRVRRAHCTAPLVDFAHGDAGQHREDAGDDLQRAGRARITNSDTQ
jgi:hypothetical protein